MQVMARVGREYLWQLVAFAVAILDRLVVPAILLRSLGVGGFSGWTVAFAFAGFVPVLDFGVTRYFSNRLLMLNATNRVDEARRSFRQGTILLLSLSALATAVFVGLLLVKPPRTGDTAIDAQMLAVVLPVLLAAFLQQIIAVRVSLYRAHSEFARETALRTISDIARIGTVAMLAFSGSSLVALAWLWLGAIIIVQILPFLVDSLRRYPRFREAPVKFRRDELVDLARTAPGFWLQAALTTAFASLPIIGLGYWVAAPAVVAQFGLMRTIANLVRQVLQLFGNVFGLELARRVALDDKPGFASVFWETCRFTAAQSAAAATVLTILGRDLFTVWTAHAALFDTKLLLLAIAPPILVPSMIASTEAIAYAGRPWLIVLARIAQFVLSLLLIASLPIAAPAMRVMAALAIAEIIAFAIPLVFAIRHINRAVGFRMQLRLLAIVALSVATTFMIMLPMNSLTGASIVVRLTVGLSLALIALGATTALWGVDGRRRRAVAAMLAARLPF